MDITSELAAIKAALKQWAGPTITGSQLFSLIGSAAPKFDIRAVVDILKGPGALTEFVRRYLSGDVKRIGNQGGDVLYLIDGREAEALPSSASPQVWRTFVSPASPKHLVLIPSARRLISRDTPASTADGEVEIAKASLIEHADMRANFMASIPEPEAAVLREHVAPDVDFASWIAALKQHLPETMHRWGHFRRQQLSQLFAARIERLGLDEPMRRDVLKQIKESELLAYDMQRGGKEVSRKQGPRKADPDDTTDATSLTRRLAHAAIDLLTYDELRALRMPLGAVLDAIRAERNSSSTD